MNDRHRRHSRPGMESEESYLRAAGSGAVSQSFSASSDFCFAFRVSYVGIGPCFCFFFFFGRSVIVGVAKRRRQQLVAIALGEAVGAALTDARPTGIGAGRREHPLFARSFLDVARVVADRDDRFVTAAATGKCLRLARSESDISAQVLAVHTNALTWL